jgi:hypothetical protein
LDRVHSLDNEETRQIMNNVFTAHRGPDGGIMISVSGPAGSSWTIQQIPIDAKTALALLEDLSRMLREDISKE